MLQVNMSCSHTCRGVYLPAAGMQEGRDGRPTKPWQGQVELSEGGCERFCYELITPPAVDYQCAAEADLQ